ncbi:MAG TPA: 8-amino-7-oxononanoate synthase [Cycloclasticus sp.]|jgi:8-amino-7-oxononanoate synthase|nr:8-amino-7-oxononanoate synthase [Cycloclasticus sp.]HIL93028.1 8-amino-7-oxononanoate synthase [Cycloclasticus sp.]
MKRWNLAAQLDALKRQQLYRTRQIVGGPQGPQLVIDGTSFDNFSSNDYLGLANHPEVIAAFQKAASEYGVGSGSAHLICGHSSEHHALEEELAEFTGRERALVFSTGYMANMGVISALVTKGDAIFQDKLNHASLIDGARLSGAELKRYSHNDLDRLQQLLQQSSSDKKLIITDGVFSMDGDEADVKRLASLAAEHDAALMIDDAHGVGVLGGTGAGLLEQHGLNQQQVPILMATLGKGLGTAGAFVAGSDALIETLIQRARTYIFTTAMPPAIMAATRVSLSLCQQEDWRREKLVSLVSRFRHGAQQLGLNLMSSKTPIQPVVLGSNQAVVSMAAYLKDKGFLVGAIRHPTVAKSSERLRITLSATHTESQVDSLLSALEGAMRD